jgi:hypothetical protein
VEAALSDKRLWGQTQRHWELGSRGTGNDALPRSVRLSSLLFSRLGLWKRTPPKLEKSVKSESGIRNLSETGRVANRGGSGARVERALEAKASASLAHKFGAQVLAQVRAWQRAVP